MTVEGETLHLPANDKELAETIRDIVKLTSNWCPYEYCYISEQLFNDLLKLGHWANSKSVK